MATDRAAKAGRFQMGGVLMVGAGHAVHDTYTAFLNPLLPTFIANLALSNAQAGLLTVFVRLPSLFQPMLGHLSDRFHLRQLFILAPAVSAAMMSLLGIAPNYAILALLLVATGFSSASLHAVGPAIVGGLSGRKLGRGMGFWMVGGELGRTLGPIAIVSAVQFLHLDGMPCLMIVGILASVGYALPDDRGHFGLGCTLGPAQRRTGPASLERWPRPGTALATSIAADGAASPLGRRRLGAYLHNRFAVHLSAHLAERGGRHPLVCWCLSISI